MKYLIYYKIKYKKYLKKMIIYYSSIIRYKWYYAIKN